MPDILIRNVSEAAIERIDQLAGELGISRNEYLRRQLEQTQRPDHRPTTVDDLKRSAAIFVDLGDPDVMDGAWR